jgi:hypothetical protein
MELITNWQYQDLICAFCGTKKSVKYKVPMIIIDSIPTGEKTESKVCACNKCALLFSKPEVK